MSGIIDFKPQSQLKAAGQLDAFIAWAKATLLKGVPNRRVHAGIQWDMYSWHRSGITKCAFTAHGSSRKAKDKQHMQPPFIDFAKALIVYYHFFLVKKSASDFLAAARILEVVLVESTGTRDVTKVTAAICNKACEYFISEYPNGNAAYYKSKRLEKIVQLMRDKELLAIPFRWTSPLRWKRAGTLKEQRSNREKNCRAVNLFWLWVNCLIIT